MERPLKVVYFIEGNGGGAITHCLTLARELAQKIRTTVIFFLDGPMVSLAREWKLDYRLLPWKFDIDFTLAWRLRRLLQEERADILHTHTITGNFYGRWASCCLRPRPILVSTVHSFVIDELKGTTRITWKDYLRYKREIWLSIMTNHFIAVSPGIKKRLTEKGVPSEKIEVITNAIMQPETLETHGASVDEVRLRFHLEENQPVIAVIGRLVPLKNHRMFLKAARMVLETKPQVKFLVIGEGPLKNSLEQLAGELGIGANVVFTGWQNHLAPFYQIIDILVQCSITESQGLAILEAMSYGKAIIATDIDDIAKTVIDGQTGLLVPLHDEAALAQAIVKLIQDKELAGKLGKAGKFLTESEYAADRMIAQTMSVYEKLWSAKKDRPVANSKIPKIL